jgi:hypothetical protein
MDFRLVACLMHALQMNKSAERGLQAEHLTQPTEILYLVENYSPDRLC